MGSRNTICSEYTVLSWPVRHFFFTFKSLRLQQRRRLTPMPRSPLAPTGPRPSRRSGAAPAALHPPCLLLRPDSVSFLSVSQEGFSENSFSSLNDTFWRVMCSNRVLQVITTDLNFWILEYFYSFELQTCRFNTLVAKKYENMNITSVRGLSCFC